MENEKLQKFIYQQLQSGLSPDEITQQLRDAGWSEINIATAFQAVQGSITPTPSEPISAGRDIQTDGSTEGRPAPSTADTQPTPAYEPKGRKRGRIKTAWVLMKQSLKVLRNNKVLIRYPFIAAIIAIAVTAVFFTIGALGRDIFFYSGVNALGEEEMFLTAYGVALVFVYYVTTSFIIFTYNSALAAHVLEIFRGKSRGHKDYMRIAWSKKGPIFLYSLITTTVGMLLRAIESRSRLLGRIVTNILGALWELANIFTIPIIVETDSGAPTAIKNSALLFKSRWGENIAARIGFGALMFLLYLIIFIPLLFVLLFVGQMLGDIGFVFFFILLIASIILFITVEVAASNILNVALYYYAQYGKIPAAFDSEILNSVFIPEKAKKRGLFGKK